MQAANLRSVAYLTVSGAEPVEQIEAAAAAGFDAVGLRVVAPLGLELQYPITGNKPLLKSIRQALALTGLRVFDTELVTITADTEPNDFTPAIETAAELGSGYMQATSEDPDSSRGADNFAMVCDVAASCGVRMALEFMRFRSVRTIEEAAEFVRRAGRANAGILLDCLHLYRSGGSPAAVRNVPQQYLTYVQLCDGPAKSPSDNDGLKAEARSGRLYPGEGDFWLDELFDVLPDDIPISIEVPGAIAMDASVEERTRRAGQALNAYLTRYRARPA
jgi:sugar phosphate isomerase/epimerase